MTETVRQGTCVECGQGFPVATAVGPLPARCPGCLPGYRRRQDAERAQRKRDRERGSTRVISCVDCGERLEWDGKSRPKLRCDSCRKAHTLEYQRVRYASDRADAPELARERWRQGYRR